MLSIGAISIPPPFGQPMRIINLKNPRTFIPLIIQVSRVHFFHLKVTKDRKIRFYARRRQTRTYSLRGNINQIDVILF